MILGTRCIQAGRQAGSLREMGGDGANDKPSRLLRYYYVLTGQWSQ